MRKYVFTLRNADALCSLIAFVAGITRIKVSNFVTSDMPLCIAGENNFMYSIMVQLSRKLASYTQVTRELHKSRLQLIILHLCNNINRFIVVNLL